MDPELKWSYAKLMPSEQPGGCQGIPTNSLKSESHSVCLRHRTLCSMFPKQRVLSRRESALWWWHLRRSAWGMLVVYVEMIFIDNPTWSSQFSWAQCPFLFSMNVWKKGGRPCSPLHSPERLLPAWQPPAPWTGSVFGIPQCSLHHKPGLHMLSAVLLLQSPLPTREGN